MAKHSKSDLDGIPQVDTLVNRSSLNYTNTEQSISVMCIYPAHIKHTGQVTGKQYEWLKSGDVIDVSLLDWPSMEGMTMGKRFCCGGGTNLMFKQV